MKCLIELREMENSDLEKQFREYLEKTEGVWKQKLFEIDFSKILNPKDREIIKELDGKYNLSNECFKLDKKGNVIELDLRREDSILDMSFSMPRITMKKKLSKIPEHIQNLLHLQSLFIISNKITEIIHLDGMINLKHVVITYNQIDKIKGLDTLVGLEGLSLGSNKIKKIEGLNHLKKLKGLSISTNQISKIEGLENLVNLERLDLGRNKITQIEGLDNLVALKVLKLEGNSIKNMEGLDRLVNLKELDLSGNKIKYVRQLKHLENLSKVILFGNRLSAESEKKIRVDPKYLHESKFCGAEKI
ncbi:MAG: leucine-rich repeat protein [Candidatus Helarchaeota archaeon]|nr:leucine-rich repeat protein [Candidatus Helarchaeota archaeon]